MYEKDEKLFILLLFATSFLLLSWPQLRLGTFLGSDVYGELFVAQYTYDFGLTQILMQKERYGNVLSVTILPSVISKITGIPVTLVFATVLTGVVAFVPILSYILMRRVAKCRKIAALSSLVFIFDYTFFNVFPALIREDIALMFLLLALYVVYAKQEHPSIAYALIFLLSVVGIVVSHYTVALFAIAIFACLYLLDRWKGNSGRRSTSDLMMLFVPILTLAWLMFISPTVLNIIVEAVQWYSRVANILSAHPYSNYLLSSPRGGTFSTIIVDAYRGLIVMGAAIAFLVSRSARKQLQIFVLQGVTFFFLTIPFIVLPIGRSVPLDRVWAFGLVFMSFFAATAIVRIGSLASGLIRHFVGVHRVTHFAEVATVIFLLSLFFVNHVVMSPPVYYGPDLGTDNPVRLRSDQLFVKWAENELDPSMLVLADVKASDLLKYSSVFVMGENLHFRGI